MPKLDKVAKQLYEAALRRKGLQPGKAVRQDPRTFVGPIRTYADEVPSARYNPRPRYNPNYRLKKIAVQRPYDTYWNRRGRLQDLENELQAANNAGLIELKNPLRQSYRRYYNDGDIPNIPAREGRDYDSPYGYRYNVPYAIMTADGLNIGYRTRPHLTRMGELELEARADEMIENEYKDYLRNMYEGKIPMREGYSAEDLAEYMEPGYYVKR